MDDTISREAARRAVRNLYVKEVTTDDSAYNMAIDQADDVIKKLPSAERRGRWKQTKGLYSDPNGNLFFGKICSECNGVSPYDYPYCMNCGAKMDEVEGDAE